MNSPIQKGLLLAGREQGGGRGVGEEAAGREGLYTRGDDAVMSGKGRGHPWTSMLGLCLRYLTGRALRVTVLYNEILNVSYKCQMVENEYIVKDANKSL